MLAEEFLDWADLQMSQWQAQWQALGPGNSAADCTRGTEFVRLFDAMSLWLLCAERTHPTTFETPDGQKLTLTPEALTTIRVDPWPYSTSHRVLLAAGRSIPVRNYRSSDELLKVPSKRAEFIWNLLPGNQVE